MRDIVFVLLLVGFFAIAAAYGRACSAVVGTEAAAEPDEPRDEEEAAAA